ncbi:MAG: hypothetical protein OEQ74_05965, partial [Gammaproteobacteria bacterium]|nr:hypothetical protein [Gammaproteobacteria bacterium]
ASDGFLGTGVELGWLYVVTPGNVNYVYTGLQQNGSSGTFNYSMTSGDGSYRFAIRARDNGGNAEAIPASVECFVALDTVDPASTVSTPLFVGGGAIPLTWSVTDATPSSGLEFVDFWQWREPAGPWLWTGLSGNVNNGVVNWVPPGPGVYHFFSRAKDNAQNIETGGFGPPPLDSVTNYGNVDTDSDGRPDLSDNCKLLFNPDQRDTNGDLIGNLCDPDISNNCVADFADVALIKAAFLTNPGSANWNPDADFDGGDFVGFTDLAILKDFFLGPPGPGAAGACNF